MSKTMKPDKTLADSVERWERDGDLGKSVETARSVDPSEEPDEGTTPTSIRIPKPLMADLKALARRNGIGYQPYMRMVLTNHVNQAREAKQL